MNKIETRLKIVDDISPTIRDRFKSYSYVIEREGGLLE